MRDEIVRVVSVTKRAILKGDRRQESERFEQRSLGRSKSINGQDRDEAVLLDAMVDTCATTRPQPSAPHAQLARAG